MKSLSWTLLFASVAVIASCAGQTNDSQAPGRGGAREGDACGGKRQIACDHDLECREQRGGVASRPPESKNDQFLSDVGGPCGGIAGYHCLEGLACDMTAEQDATEDGMGACAYRHVCVAAWRK